ncbi:MAG: hypothetical protein JRJ51_15735 [Deltaproteobacteria bacterium]|nr:hypothetical protein [Deltaproteobacteria bacterium]
MKKHKKIFLWVVGVLGFLLFLFTIFLLVLPSFINIEPIRERILANLSKEVGGKVTYQKVDISFLPLPRMVVHNVGLSIPGKTQGTIRAVVVYPKIGALLKGRVELSGLVLASPRFRIDLPERTPGEGHAPEKASPLLVPFSLDLPVEDLALEQGKLEIFQEGQRLFGLQNIEAQLESQDKGISLDLSCASNVVERFSLKGRFDPETFKGRGQIDLVRIKPHLLTQAFLQDKGFRLGQSLANLKLNMVVNGPQAMTGKFQGSIPSLILIQGERQLSVEAGEITGSFQKAKEKTTVSLNNLSLDQPQATLAATLVLGKVTPLMVLKVEGKEVDVHSIRKAALEFLGDDETVQEIFEIVRGGHLPSITFETRGDTGDDLGDLQNMVIKGRIEQGKIRVPGVDMDLVEVTGDTVISQGILKGENLAARDGKTLGREGKLELGLEGDDAPFHLDILVDTDLAMLPPLLKKVVDNRALIKELGLIKGLSGKATGRLVLGDRMNAMIPRVDVSPFNLSAKYGRLPFGITVKGGRLVYDQTGIRLDKVKVDIGKSSVSGLSGRVNLGKTPNMDITYKGSRVNLGELFPWLRTQEWWHVKPRDLKSIEGILSSSGAHIKGPLLSPEKWQVTVNGKMQDIVLDSESIPGPMKVSEGNFRVVQRAADQKLTVEAVHIGILDSSFQVSGVLSDYLEGLNRVEMSMQGTVDKAVVRYLGSRFQVPPHLHLKTPISLSRSQLAWERGKQASFQGGGMIQGGPQFSLDLVAKPGELVIKDLRIHDEESQAEFGLDQKEDMIEVRLKGHLKRKTLNGLFVEQPFHWGEIKGDIKAQVFLNDPMKSRADGTLEGDDLIIRLGLKQPMRIDNISLNAQGQHIDVQSAGLLYQDHQLLLEGGLDFSEAGLKIDLDARTGDLDWEKLSAIIKAEQAGEGAGRLLYIQAIYVETPACRHLPGFGRCAH